MRGDREKAIRLLSETNLKLREIHEQTEVPLGSLGKLSAMHRHKVLVENTEGKLANNRDTNLEKKKNLAEDMIRYSGRTLNAIAEEVGLPYSVVRRLANGQERGTEIPREKPAFHDKGVATTMTDEWIHEHLVEKSMTLHEMGEILGVSRERVRQILEKKGINPKDFKDNAKRYWRKNHVDALESTPVNRHYFDKIDTEEKAYWLGYITAKGRVTSYNEHSRLRFEINISNQNFEHINKFLETIEADVKLGRFVNKPDNGKEYVNHHARINSHYFASKLQEDYHLESPKYDLTHMPESIPEDLRRHYFRGHFDGKGFIWKNLTREGRGMFFMYGSDPLLYDFCIHLTENLDIAISDKAVRFPGDHHRHCQFSTTSNRNISTIMHYLYDDATIYHPRNFEKFKEVFEG